MYICHQLSFTFPIRAKRDKSTCLLFSAITMKIPYISLAILSLVHSIHAVDAETHKTRAQLLKEGLEADVLDARELISPGPP